MSNVIPAEDAIRTALATAHEFGELTSSISAINSVRVPDEWWTGTRRILMIGQETGGETRTLQWMIDATDGIADVVESYETFDFAENTSVRNSPFWRAHRLLASELEDGVYRKVMWTNLVEVQSLNGVGGGIHNVPEPYRSKVIEWQAPVVKAEFKNLAPQAAIFFTGPVYDWILETVFPGVRLAAIESTGHPVRTLARLSHPQLPERSFRTYHPGFLQRQKMWNVVDDVIGLLK
ncbi:hypothetical protein [Mesorhizobium sp. ES1-6]|uniref:hypothetical protein n=1 Tax=Mesorhizobium sp. ES1-6 TaxID=2876626 RepID=UPI001CCBC421|nr:hypothetical protein [Mesorhizobium sp. ES1-6]MBZ9801098.1 hypothetical protein [Mesorhizobium sp. ES1-6]